MTTAPLTFEAFLQRRAGDRRLARLTHDIPMPEGRGLEFGAASLPTSLSAGHPVEYVDYARDASHDPDAVHVDHVWTGAGSFAEICGRDAVYDFAIASQVAQYVPNLLGWFRGIFDVLRVGGVLNLALPDRRFTFDIERTTSTLGELIEAFQLDYDRPSVRQLFDHTYGARAIEPERIWADDITPEVLARLGGDQALAFAYGQAREVFSSRRYVTCHCWVFTPLSFLELIEGASRIGLFPFVISQFSSTEPGGFEFFACLRRDSEEDAHRLQEKQLAAIAHVRSIVMRQNSIARRLAER